MTRWFVFDFDGVLFDTARECLAIAFRAVQGIDAPWAAAYRGSAAPSAETERSFLAHRYWVGPPWQYAVLLRVIAEGALPRTTDEFLARAGAWRDELEPFTERYFAARGELAADRVRWLALATPYAAAAGAFQRMHARGEVAILSTRDDVSIRRICEHYLGVANAEVLPRAGKREKWEILLDAAATRNLAPGEVFFLDDYLHHALPARQRGFAAHLARWGYLGEGDVAAAAAGGLPSLQLSELGPALRAHATSLSKENRT